MAKCQHVIIGVIPHVLVVPMRGVLLVVGVLCCQELCKDVSEGWDGREVIDGMSGGQVCGGGEGSGGAWCCTCCCG